MPRMIEGDVLEPEDEVIRLLKRELAEVRRELDEGRANASHKEGQALAAVKALRKVFQPMYRTLQMVFGEIDAVVADADGAFTDVPSAARSVWDSWIQKLGVSTAPARLIQALLQHQALNVPQIKVAIKVGDNTAYSAIKRLTGLGLLDKSGGRYSLKKL